MIDFEHFRDIHIEDALALWTKTEWASVSQSDEPEALREFLERNPGCSWVAARLATPADDSVLDVPALIG